jgi:hypothetical protein
LAERIVEHCGDGECKEETMMESGRKRGEMDNGGKMK